MSSSHLEQKKEIHYGSENSRILCSLFFNRFGIITHRLLIIGGFDLITIIENKPYRIEVKSSKSKIKDRNGFRVCN